MYLFSNPKQFERVDMVVRGTLHSFKVEALNIYSMDNTISYSFDPDLIGRKNFGGTGYQQALEGKTTSRLVQRGNFFEISLGFPKEARLITYAPLRAEPELFRITGPVLGVVEIVQDLSEDYQTIFRIQILVVITCAVMMGALFVVLIFFALLLVGGFSGLFAHQSFSIQIFDLVFLHLFLVRFLVILLRLYADQPRLPHFSVRVALTLFLFLLVLTQLYFSYIM